jgi:hypothetical protein
VPTLGQHCMDSHVSPQHHAPVRVLPHIKRLDDCFGDFLVRVVCECGACREIQPQALARLVGWKMTLKELDAAYALLEVREESCRGGGRCEASLGPVLCEGQSLPVTETGASGKQSDPSAHW